MGLEGGKPAAGQVGVQPEWFYKGDGSSVVGAGRAAALARVRARRRRRARDRRHLSHRPGGAAAPARLLSRQRVLRSRHRARQLSVARAFQAAAGSARRRAADRRAAARRARRQPDPARRPARCGRSHSSPAKRTCRTRSPISSTITSSIALFRRPGDVHVHFFGTATLVVRRRHPDAASAMCSRSKRGRFICRCAIRWREPRAPGRRHCRYSGGTALNAIIRPVATALLGMLLASARRTPRTRERFPPP